MTTAPTHPPDIHKAAGILIQNRQLLIEKSHNKPMFLAPGGKVEPSETPQEALIRELQEEFQISVTETDLQSFDTYYAPSAGQEHLHLRMDVFIVKSWIGTPTPDHEVDQIRWVDSQTAADLPIGSIFAHQVIPRLKKLNFID